MKLITAVVLCGLVALGHSASLSAWFTWGGEEEDILPEEDPTEECLQLASWGHCAFYDCLERRFPCGEDGYTERISKHFCSKIDANITNFDTFGRKWLNKTSICLVGDMVPLYNQDTLRCSDIQDAGIESILKCNSYVVEEKTFCDFLSTNKLPYNALMGSDEMIRLMSLGDYRVYTSMIGQAIGCGVDRLSDKLTSVLGTIGAFGQRLGESILSWFNFSNDD